MMLFINWYQLPDSRMQVKISCKYCVVCVNVQQDSFALLLSFFARQGYMHLICKGLALIGANACLNQQK